MNKDWKEELDEKVTLSAMDRDIVIDFIQKQSDKKNKEHKVNIIDTLNDYSNWLMKEGYLDSDWYCEEPHTVEEYVKINNLW